ncbi:MAG: Mrp/NBP35 family ATP-binding protein [Alphaproteobacteria bacterium]|nr:Mrp/NBP35 family ATP-binding protein [Alphaproteobacteria bacterium]
MTEAEIEEIAAKYYPRSNLSTSKIVGNRIILEYKNLAENPQITDKLKQHIATIEPEYKISILFVEEKNVNIGVQAIEKWQIKGVKKIIGVASGKGGVGKSTTAVNLALALANCGKRVALVDADIYGPSIPTMLGYEGSPLISEDGQNFKPFNEYGIKSISVGSLIDRNTPLIWRGAKACGAIEQLMTQTDWGEIDIMVVDMPPGTGDILITLSQRVDFDGIVIVSTPQDIALIDAIKGVNMFKKTGTQVLGIVENMSYFICPHCGQRADIFGHNGAKQTAERMGETFLGSIPLEPEIRRTSDAGTPIVAENPDSPHTKAYEEIAAKIICRIG